MQVIHRCAAFFRVFFSGLLPYRVDIYSFLFAQVELFRNDQHRLRIVVDSENEVDLMVQTRHLRDVIVLVIRGLAQRFNSTSLNSLLKIET